MKQIKQILEIERDYERIISNASSRASKRLEKQDEDFRNRELKIKDDLKKELEQITKKKIIDSREFGERMIEEAIERAEDMKESADYKEAVEFAMKKIENFGE